MSKKRRRPADHRPPTQPGPATHARAEATGDPIELTFRGIALSIDPDDIDDYDAVTALSQGIPGPLLEAMVPDPDVRDRLLETCREPGGRRRVSTVSEMVVDLMTTLGGKASRRSRAS